MYVRAKSSMLTFTLTITHRTNPVRVPGVIVRMCPSAWPTGLQGQVNPLASSETTVLRTRFGPGDAGDPLSRSIAGDPLLRSKGETFHLWVPIDKDHSHSMSEAGRQLFDASRTRKTSKNDADRLRKYLGRFGIDWDQIVKA
jgi:hypothetical protein